MYRDDEGVKVVGMRQLSKLYSIWRSRSYEAAWILKRRVRMHFWRYFDPLNNASGIVTARQPKLEKSLVVQWFSLETEKNANFESILKRRLCCWVIMTIMFLYRVSCKKLNCSIRLIFKARSYLTRFSALTLINIVWIFRFLSSKMLERSCTCGFSQSKDWTQQHVTLVN